MELLALPEHRGRWSASVLADALKQIRELQCMLSKKAMGNKILREAVQGGCSKNGLRCNGYNRVE